MRSFAGALLGLLALVAGAADAHAQTPEDRGADRRDFYLRIGGGPGYSAGVYRFSGMSVGNATVPPSPSVPLSFEAEVHGPHGEVELALGNAIAPGVAVAGVGGLRLSPLLEHRERLGETKLVGLLAGKFGLAVDVFPVPLEPFHLTAGGGGSAATFFWSRDDVGSPDNIVNPEAVSGPFGELGVGYRLGPRLDLLTRLAYAHLEGSQSTYHPLSLSILASYLRF